MIVHYILEGHEPRPVEDALEWARWFETADRHVARTDLVDGSWISTVFLGLDHSFDLGPPVLFETCLFFHEDVEPGSYIGDQKVQSSEVRARYRTWAEAEQGHMEICEELASALPAWNARSLP